MSAEESAPLRPRKALPWATGFVVIVALAIQAWPGEAASLQFDRDRIPAGELWRVWTAHCVHFSWSHLGWNLAVLVPAGLWVERAAARRARLFYVVAPAVVAVVLLVFDPLLRRYAGLSALAVGALALLAFTHLGRSMGSDRWFWWAVLAVLGAKIGLEFFLGESTWANFGDASIKSVPLAHVAGIASAALVHGTRRRFNV